MSLNDYRDEVKEFLLKVDALGKNQDGKLAWLTEELDLLKRAVKDSDNKALSHQIYDMMYLLFEVAADYECDLNSDWDAGERRKTKKYLSDLK